MKSIAKNSLVYGNFCEDRALEHLLGLGYVYHGRNVKTRYGEVDLLFTFQRKLVAVEVKSVPHRGWELCSRVSKKQILRLKNIVTDLSHKNKSVRLHLALVFTDGRVKVIEDFLCDLL